MRALVLLTCWLGEGVPALPEMLKAAGYSTCMAGGWHAGCSDPEPWPTQRGFDRCYGFIPDLVETCLNLGGGTDLFATLPADSFVGCQLAAQRLRPDSFLMVAGFADSAPGYIRTDACWREVCGGDYCWVPPMTEAAIIRARSDVLSASGAAEKDLIGHWPLKGDARDVSPNALHGQPRGVIWDSKGHAGFDGRSAWLEVPASSALHLGARDFTVALWLQLDAVLDDSPGDLLTLFDPATRTGFNLTVQHQSGTCSSMANTRNLFFGLDAGTAPCWTDCGRPGHNQMVYALTVFKGALYAGTWEPGAGEAGHVYRYGGGTKWEDCGAPDRCNAVSALAVFNGELYAGVASYSGAGSQLKPSPNTHPGGRVYRYAGDQNWLDCGRICDAEVVWGMTVFQGRLYVTAMDLPPKHDLTPRQGLYRYEGGTNWTWCGNPGGRLAALTVANGRLFGSGYSGGQLGGVFRYDGGTNWSNWGAPPNVDQTYSFVFHRGEMHTGTWKEGKVFRYLGPNQWEDAGRLGGETEVMCLALFNGKLYGGTLPLAQVYRCDGAGWALTGQLDDSDVVYRRAWSMAVYGGRLFCGTLPAGRVRALEAGVAASHDFELAPGWRHVAAVRGGNRLRLFVDGKRAATSAPFDPPRFDLTANVPLKIGFGEHDYFHGRLRDVRLYGRALSDRQVSRLFRKSK